MILISHRGNTIGPIESWENEPTYIELAISKGFEVEVDVWYVDGMLYLGHDKPQYGVDLRWLKEIGYKLWLHCKNVEALWYFSVIDEPHFHYFWHETDTVALTSKHYLWVYPGKQPIKESIAVMPEINGDDLRSCKGICSDYIENYKNDIINIRN